MQLETSELFLCARRNTSSGFETAVHNPPRVAPPRRYIFAIELEVIDVADGAGLPSGGHHHLHHLPAGDQLHALMRERLEVLPAAGVGNGDRPGPVNAVELEAERAARALARDVHVDAVRASLL